MICKQLLLSPISRRTTPNANVNDNTLLTQKRKYVYSAVQSQKAVSADTAFWLCAAVLLFVFASHRQTVVTAYRPLREKLGFKADVVYI